MLFRFGGSPFKFFRLLEGGQQKLLAFVQVVGKRIDSIHNAVIVTASPRWEIGFSEEVLKYFSRCDDSDSAGGLFSDRVRPTD